LASSPRKRQIGLASKTQGGERKRERQVLEVLQRERLCRKKEAVWTHRRSRGPTGWVKSNGIRRGEAEQISVKMALKA